MTATKTTRRIPHKAKPARKRSPEAPSKGNQASRGKNAARAQACEGEDQCPVERIGGGSPGILANRWTGYFAPDLEQLRVATDHNLAFLKKHLVGKTIENRTGHTVEELLSTYVLSFGGVPSLRSWQPMRWTPGVLETLLFLPGSNPTQMVEVQEKHDEILLLLLALAWTCTLTTHESAETERARGTVSTAIKAFCTASEPRSRGTATVNAEKKKQAQATGDEVEAHWNDRSTVSYVKKHMSWSITKRKPITDRCIRDHVHKRGLKNKTATKAETR